MYMYTYMYRDIPRQSMAVLDSKTNSNQSTGYVLSTGQHTVPTCTVYMYTGTAIKTELHVHVHVYVYIECTCTCTCMYFRWDSNSLAG